MATTQESVRCCNAAGITLGWHAWASLSSTVQHAIVTGVVQAVGTQSYVIVTCLRVISFSTNPEQGYGRIINVLKGIFPLVDSVTIYLKEKNVPHIIYIVPNSRYGNLSVICF